MSHNPDQVRLDCFAYAREREKVRILKEAGAPKPWTDDPILQNNRFCCVRREDDKVTRWFRENMRNVPRFSYSGASILLTTVAFRWFNKIEMGRLLSKSKVGLDGGLFHGPTLKYLAEANYPKGPYVTGAYIVKTPDGKKKLDGVIWCIEQVAAHAENISDAILRHGSLEKAWELLISYPYLGPFMAYEVVTDLRHTRLLSTADDIMSWANPGPGCARGISRVHTGDPEAYNRSNFKHREIMMKEMQLMVEMSRDPELWPYLDRPWEMREAEHLFCETDKLTRAREGGRMKQRYDGAL